MHIDTGWKFAEMISFRDAAAQRLGLDLRVVTNEAGRAEGCRRSLMGRRSTPES